MLGKFLFFFLQIDRKKLGSCSTLARRALRVVPPKHSLYLVIFTLLGHSTKRYLSEYYTTPKLRSRTMVQAKLHCKNARQSSKISRRQKSFRYRAQFRTAQHSNASEWTSHDISISNAHETPLQKNKTKLKNIPSAEEFPIHYRNQCAAT